MRDNFVKRVDEDGKPKSYIPTDLAWFIYSKLPDELKSAELTAEWENKLSKIENGILVPRVFLKEIEEFIKRIVL